MTQEKKLAREIKHLENSVKSYKASIENVMRRIEETVSDSAYDERIDCRIRDIEILCERAHDYYRQMLHAQDKLEMCKRIQG